MSSRLSTESWDDSLALKEVSKCLRVQQMNHPCVPFPEEPLVLLIKGNPGHKLGLTLVLA